MFMNQSNDFDLKSEYFLKFSLKYPELKTQIISRAINDFNCDYDKIDDYLLSCSFQESSSISKKSSGDSVHSPMFSFNSLNSDCAESENNSPAVSKSHYKNSRELCTISSQMSDLRKLQEAFKSMENNRDMLKKEMAFLKEIFNQRKLISNFPDIIAIEKLEMVVNKKFGMPPKAMSYANDLRRPEEMNARYRGFHQPCNINDNGVTNNNNMSRRSSECANNHNLLNPNFYLPSKAKNQFFSPLKKLDEKRNSAHFNDNFELPEELVGHKRSHHRQKSDSSFLDGVDGNIENASWKCSLCLESNTETTCSFCCMHRNQSERF